MFRPSQKPNYLNNLRGRGNYVLITFISWMLKMKISDIRNNKTTVAVVIVLMIFSLPSNLIFITSTEDLTYCSAVQDFYLLPPASLLHYEFTGNQITSQLAVQSSLGVTLQHFRSARARGGPLLLGCVFWLGNTSQWYWLTSEEILGKYSFCMLEIPIFLLFQANNEAIFTNH